MIVGVPREIMPQEGRVAAIPETVKQMVGAGLAVLVESGAGKGCFIPDKAYKAAGAEIAEAIDDEGAARAKDVVHGAKGLAGHEV